ncbi:beta-lactamase-like protein [Flagelloscypha sp. PMI_526]|nr:beta-lactamase-like protein [Flagelloscypha sp. PMI_526]
MSGYKALGIPSSLATVDLTVFRISHLPTVLPAAPFILPVLPGRENLDITTYSWLISNKKKNKKILFDLGPRKDVENLSPAVRALTKGFELNAPKDITELLHNAETPLDAINAVIFSHVHFDHVGDMSLFPSSTELFIGPGTVRDVYNPISNPNGTLLATDFANRTVTELNFTGSKTKIGGFAALDYFEDGSLYILSVPGHMPGHVAALLRVQPTSFVLLSADSFHHAGQIRPTAALHKAVPISEELLYLAHDHISRDYFRSGGNDTTGFDFKARSGPFFNIPELGGFYQDPATSRTSWLGIEAFDANDDVFVVGSHDSTIYPLTPEDKTTTFNDWKALGFKKQVTWQFVNISTSAFRLSPA